MWVYEIAIKCTYIGVPKITDSGELGGVWDGGRLRCLHGKVDTTISCVCTCTVGSAHGSGCMVFAPGAMAAI